MEDRGDLLLFRPHYAFAAGLMLSHHIALASSPRPFAAWGKADDDTVDLKSHNGSSIRPALR